MIKKIFFTVSLLGMFFVSISGYANVFLQTNTQSQTNVNQTAVSNGLGKVDINFTSYAGGQGYSIFCSGSGSLHYDYIRAFAIFDATVAMKNIATGEVYNVPVTCPSCQVSIGDGFISAGGSVPFSKNQACAVGILNGTFVATTSLQTSLYVSLLDSRIPAGAYQGSIIGSVGEMSEGYIGEYINYTQSIIRSGLKTGVSGVSIMKFDIVIPDYTICTTNSPLTIDHGSMTPDQVQGNLKSQSLSIACTGPATIKLTMNNFRPQVGSGIKSHIQMSSDNINWAESSQTTLNSLGTEIINFSSTLETTGAITPQSLNGSAVVTMNYQ
jgi:hypothetical protein